MNEVLIKYRHHLNAPCTNILFNEKVNCDNKLYIYIYIYEIPVCWHHYICIYSQFVYSGRLKISKSKRSKVTI